MQKKICIVTSMLVIVTFLLQTALWAYPAEFHSLRAASLLERMPDRIFFTSKPNGQRVAYAVTMPDPNIFTGKRPVLFLFHGLGGHMGEPHIRSFAEKFAKDGFVVVRIDFTNNQRPKDNLNRSDGHLRVFSLEGELDDVGAVISDLRRKRNKAIDFSETIIGGHSYGGLVARRVAALSWARPQDDSRFNDLNVRCVVDMSGIVSPPGSVKKVLENQQRLGNIQGTVEAAYKNWKRTDEFEPFDGQRFYVSRWEGYSARDDVAHIPQDVPYIYIVGTQDGGVRCEGIPEQATVSAFMAEVALRPNAAVLVNYDMGHGYPAELLPQIIKDVCARIPYYYYDRLRGFEKRQIDKIAAAHNNDPVVRNIIAGVKIGKISTDEAAAALIEPLKAVHPELNMTGKESDVGALAYALAVVARPRMVALAGSQDAQPAESDDRIILDLIAQASLSRQVNVDELLERLAQLMVRRIENREPGLIEIRTYGRLFSYLGKEKLQRYMQIYPKVAVGNTTAVYNMNRINTATVLYIEGRTFATREGLIFLAKSIIATEKVQQAVVARMDATGRRNLPPDEIGEVKRRVLSDLNQLSATHPDYVRLISTVDLGGQLPEQGIMSDQIARSLLSPVISTVEARIPERQERETAIEILVLLRRGLIGFAEARNRLSALTPIPQLADLLILDATAGGAALDTHPLLSPEPGDALSAI